MKGSGTYVTSLADVPWRVKETSSRTVHLNIVWHCTAWHLGSFWKGMSPRRSLWRTNISKEINRSYRFCLCVCFLPYVGKHKDQKQVKKRTQKCQGCFKCVWKPSHLFYVGNCKTDTFNLVLSNEFFYMFKGTPIKHTHTHTFSWLLFYQLIEELFNQMLHYKKI